MSKLQWFRLYSRMIDDDKLRLLAFEDRWHFVALCCLKSDGLLDEPDSEMRQRRIAVRMGIQARELEEIARRLREVSLIDEALNPIAWNELQYKSDNSTARVQAYREKKEKQASKTVKRSCNVSETVQEQSRTETEQNITRKRDGAKHSIPDDWELPAKSDLPPKARALAEQWTQASYETHGEAFKGFWQTDGRRYKNWTLVWANRIVSIHGQVMRDQKYGNAAPDSPQPSAKPMTDAEWLAKCEEKALWAREEGLTMAAREWEGKAAEVRARMGFKLPDLKVVN